MLSLNALIGLIMFEYAWAKSYRARNPIKELDDMFPAYKRHDALKWKKWYFYPGALTLLVPRAIAAILVLASLVIWINITMIGQERNVPIGSCRRSILLFWYKLHTYLICGLTFFTRLTWERVSKEEVNGYSDYLGSLDTQMTRRNTLGEALESMKSISASMVSQQTHDTPNLDMELMGNLAATPRLRRVPKRGPGRPAIIVSNH